MSKISIPEQGLSEVKSLGKLQLCLNLFKGEDGNVAVLKCNVSNVSEKGKLAKTGAIGIEFLNFNSLKGLSDYVENWLDETGYSKFKGYVYVQMTSLWKQAGYRS